MLLDQLLFHEIILTQAARRYPTGTPKAGFESSRTLCSVSLTSSCYVNASVEVFPHRYSLKKSALPDLAQCSAKAINESYV
jgi:hypothetical protein